MQLHQWKMQGGKCKEDPQPASTKCPDTWNRLGKIDLMRCGLRCFCSSQFIPKLNVRLHVAQHSNAFLKLKNSTACGGGDFRLSRFVPELNVWLQVVHHFLELREVQRLRAVADGFLRRGMHFHD